MSIPHPGGLGAARAGFAQEAAVQGAGEGDGQLPGFLPRPAVLLLDRAAVAGEAVGAEPGGDGEQPVVEDDRRALPDQRSRDGRVAVCPGGERQGAGLVGGQPCRLGEARDVEVEQQAPRMTPGPAWRTGQAGELRAG